jgi:hypothetical protein
LPQALSGEELLDDATYVFALCDCLHMGSNRDIKNS